MRKEEGQGGGKKKRVRIMYQQTEYNNTTRGEALHLQQHLMHTTKTTLLAH